MTEPAPRWDIVFSGPPHLAHRFVAGLQAEGAEVEWEPPMERRGGEVHDVIVGLVAAGSYDTIKRVIALALEQWPQIKVHLRDERG